MIAKLWRKAVQWVEVGDLILPLVVVSIAHYASVLGSRDWWVVAFAIGLLVDLAGYRLTRAAIRRGGWFWLEAVAMGILAFGFHARFYLNTGDEWFFVMVALTIPMAIVFLAHLGTVEHWDTKARKATNETQHESHETPTETHAGPRMSYDAFVGLNASRNGNGPISATELMEQHGIPKATAYRWVKKYETAQSEVKDGER